MEVANVPCRVLRIGFLGELGFELHMPSDQAVHVWEQLQKSGESHGLQSTAIMGMSVLRLEKGHIIPGHDIDASVNLFEAGMGFAWDRDHTGFVGEDALKALENQTPERQLVRFKTDGKSSITPASDHDGWGHGSRKNAVRSLQSCFRSDHRHFPREQSPRPYQ